LLLGVRTCLFESPEIWEQLRTKDPVVGWYKIVWFSSAIPRHSFILWLVLRDALSTKERMCMWSFECPSVCLFCHGRHENRGPLFFNCSFSWRIWRALMTYCLVHGNIPRLEEVIVSQIKWEVRSRILTKCSWLEFAAFNEHVVLV
jgi:hypothetical protein